MATEQKSGEPRIPAVVAEDRFIQAILANPDDVSIRLVYADWLEERGDSRGEFLRLEAALMGLPREDPRWAGMAVRLRELRATLDRDWLTALGRSPIERCQLPSFEFQCPRQWDHLRLTASVDVRICSVCRLPVHYCHSIEEAQRQARSGRCVAVNPAVERKPGDLAPRRMLLGLIRMPPPGPSRPEHPEYPPPRRRPRRRRR
jgi:uncharacterized protein (TIGR02996 family)